MGDEKRISQPHDRLFKRLLEEPGVAGALLRERLPPKLVEKLADAEPELIPGTYVGKKLRETRSDRLYRLRLRDGETAYLYCLVEHKSAPDPWIALQLLGYLTEIWQRLAPESKRPGKLPLVVPLVVYHGKTRWKGPRRFAEGLAFGEELWPGVLDFPFEVLDVGHVEPPALSADPGLRGGLLLLRYALRLPREGSLEALVRMLEDLRTLSDAFLAEAGPYMFRQYATVPREVLREAIRRGMPEKEEQMLSRAVRETLEEGRAEGRVEGRAAGMAKVLRRQLERRHGALDEATVARIQSASEEELDRWTDRVLEARTLEEVFGP